MVKDIVNELHETTIATSKVTCYIDLLHVDFFSLSPSESNMFLNFCMSINFSGNNVKGSKNLGLS